MKPRPKDQLFGAYLLDVGVADVLATARRAASEATPDRSRELRERIAQVVKFQDAGETDKLGAACFHLGVAVGAVVSFRGKAADQQWVEMAEKLISKLGRVATNRKLQKLMGDAGAPNRSEHAFDEWLRRNVRSKMRNAEKQGR